MKDRLIEKLRHGDAAAFEALMKKYAAYVYAVVKNHSAGLLTHEDIEELTADTFAALWLGREALDPTRTLMPLLAVTARNKTLNRLRTVRLTVGLEEAAEIADESVPDEWESAAAEDILEGAEQLDRVSREVFLRHYIYGEPLDRIAKGLGMSPGSVRTRLFRARERIKKYLSERGYFNG